MITRTAECIDIWTKGNENPLRFEAFECNGETLWHIHEEYFANDVCTYDHIDFCGTFTECIEVMREFINMGVAK